MLAYTTFYEHWIAKFELPENLLTENCTEFINNEVTTLCHLYNIKYKNRTSHVPWTKRHESFTTRISPMFLMKNIPTYMIKKYTDGSTDVKLFPLAYFSQTTTALELSSFETVFNQKPRNPITFTTNSSKNA